MAARRLLLNRDSRINRAWVALARFIAGDTAGGLRRSSTKRRWSSIDRRICLLSLLSSLWIGRSGM